MQYKQKHRRLQYKHPDNGVLSDEDLAASYRPADRMYKEAKRSREQAEELVPLRRKVKPVSKRLPMM